MRNDRVDNRYQKETFRYIWNILAYELVRTKKRGSVILYYETLGNLIGFSSIMTYQK